MNLKDIFKLEDRVLFDAAGAADIVDAAGAAEVVSSTGSENENTEQENVVTAPVIDVADVSSAAQNPAVENTGDIEAAISALIEGVVPGNMQDAEDSAAELGNYAEIYDKNVTISTDRELVVINSGVKDIQSITDHLKPSSDVLILQDGNGLDELNAYLDAQNVRYSAIHFVTHGLDGEITVNGEVTDIESFDAADWADVGEHLTDNGDILFYGCRTAGSDEGRLLIDMIADASGADVAASTDTTGLSGNWVLEHTVGSVDTAFIRVTDYSYNLAGTEVDVSSFSELESVLGSVSVEDLTVRITQSFTIESDIIFDCSSNLDLKITSGIDAVTGNALDIVLTGGDSTNIFSFSDWLGEYDFNVTIENIDFIGNGGFSLDYAIDATNVDNLTVNSCTFTGFDSRVINYSAIGGTLSVSNSTFTGNETLGGAIDATGKNLLISSSTFSGNQSNDGTVRFVADDGGVLHIADSSFIGNTSSGTGGAVNVVNAAVTVAGSYFSENISESDGGALEIGQCSSVTITGCSFDNNQTVGRGGAVHIVECGSVSVNNSTFYMNSAERGGAVGIAYANSTDAVTVQNSTFYNNTATEANGGGAIYNGAGDLTVENSLLLSDSNISNDLYQQVGGSADLDYVFISQDISDNAGNISLTNSQTGVAASEVFGSNVYDDVTHTIAIDAYSKAAYSGTLIGSGEDQLGSDRRTLVRDYLGLEKYSIGAVAAQIGLSIKQNDKTTGVYYTGSEITVNPDLSLVYASGDVVEDSFYSNLTADLSPINVINAGVYEIAPSNGNVTLDAALSGMLVSGYRYISGNLTVHKAEVNVQVDASKIYDGSTGMSGSEFAYTISYDNGSGFDTSMFTVTDFIYADKNVHASAAAVGTVALGSGVSDNFTINFSYYGAIDKRDLNVTAESGNLTFNGALQSWNGVSADNLAVNDSIATSSTVSGVNADTYDYTVNAGNITITDEFGADMIGNYNILSYTAGEFVIDPKAVDVIYVTRDSYNYNKYDQSDTVSAYYVDVNGNKVDVPLDWNGASFIEMGTYTVTAINNDPNYVFNNPTIELVMNNMLPSSGPFSDGLYSGYSSVEYAIVGGMLADNVVGRSDWYYGNIYSMDYSELVSKELEIHIDEDAHALPGMAYTVKTYREKVTVDPLSFRPFEMDSMLRESTHFLFRYSWVFDEHAMSSGVELDLDGEHYDDSAVQIFENRHDTLSPEHDPIYIEMDFSHDATDNESSFAVVPQKVLLPENMRENKPETEASDEYSALLGNMNIPPRAENLRSEIDKFIDEFAVIA